MTQKPLPFQLGLEEVFAIAPGVTDTEAPELCAQIAFTYWDTLHKLGYITEPPDLGVIMDLTAREQQQPQHEPLLVTAQSRSRSGRLTTTWQSRAGLGFGF